MRCLFQKGQKTISRGISLPKLWIVAGPNGAGKTTLADKYLSKHMPVISPDEIARRLNISPIEAARIALSNTSELLNSSTTFAVETTFSGKRELRLIERAKEIGYTVSLIFVCTSNPYTCELRVQQRAQGGLHNVPVDDIWRRYPRSLSNMKSAFPIVDRVLLIDSDRDRPRLFFSSRDGKPSFASKRVPLWSKDILPPRFLVSNEESSNSFGPSIKKS